MWNIPRHGYEEIRDGFVDILLGREKVTYPPDQFGSMTSGVAEVFSRREHRQDRQLHPHDAELVRDVFWDLFRQGFITLGLNDSNPMWPFFRLSHFGQEALADQKPYRFHDTTGYLAMIKSEIPDISPEAIDYLEEAVAAFFADCLLAACVMLGVAAEAEFLRLIDSAVGSARHGTNFSSVPKERFIRQKITKFQKCLMPIAATLPSDATEDLETNFAMIQSVLRISRNEAGHPNASRPSREQVYIFLQLFVPFARQLAKLRQALQ